MEKEPAPAHGEGSAARPWRGSSTSPLSHSPPPLPLENILEHEPQRLAKVLAAAGGTLDDDDDFVSIANQFS